MGLEARSLPADEGSALGRVVMVVILGDGSRNSIGGTAFHEFDLPETMKQNHSYPFWGVKQVLQSGNKIITISLPLSLRLLYSGLIHCM